MIFATDRKTTTTKIRSSELFYFLWIQFNFHNDNIFGASHEWCEKILIECLVIIGSAGEQTDRVAKNPDGDTANHCIIHVAYLEHPEYFVLAVCCECLWSSRYVDRSRIPK